MCKARPPGLISVLCVAGVLLWFWQEPPSPNEFYSATSYVDWGEGLIHRVHIEQDIAHRMPLSTILTAGLSSHRHVPPESARFFLRAIVLILSLACGWVFLPYGGLVFAVAFCGIFIKAPVVWPDTPFQDLFFSTATPVLAGLLVWRSQNPSLLRNILLSLCLGISMLFRSVFVFFPPLLLLFDYVQRGRTSRRRWGQILVLGVLPYIGLIPWLKMNWQLHHKIVPFEHQGADMNIVAGALGLVQGFTVNYTEFVGARSVLAWGMREVLSHPIRYADGFFRRWMFAVSLHPWLFLGGFVSAWVYRDRAECRWLTLLVVYYCLIYCSMAVVPRYFEPLWPLLAVLAAALPARLLDLKGAPRIRHLESRLAPALLLAWPGLMLIPTLYAEAAVWSYPVIAASDFTSKDGFLNAAILRHPDDAWLWARRGQDKLSEGKIPAAVSSFARAARLAPDKPEYALDYAWAQALHGSPEALFSWRFLPEWAGSPTARKINRKARLYKAVAYLRTGRRLQARQQLQAFLENRRSQTILSDVETDRGGAVIKSMAASDAGLRDEIDDLIRMCYWPVADRLSLLNEVAKLSPRLDLKIEQAALASSSLAEAERKMNSKEKAAVLGSLAKVEKLPLTAQDWHRLSLNYQSLRQYRRQSRILYRLIRDHPQEAVYWSDLGCCLYRLGSTAPAIGALQTAVRLNERFLPPYLSMGAIYVAEHRSREALEIYERALRRAAKDDHLWAELVNSRDNLRSRLIRR